MKENQASEPNGSKDILNDEENPIDFSKAPGEDEAILELTDEVDAALNDGQAPLELLDEVSDTREDGAILELTDEVDAALNHGQAPLELPDEVSGTREDDALLELTDAVDAALGAAAVSEPSLERDTSFTSDLSQKEVMTEDEPGYQTSEEIIDSLGMTIKSEPEAAETDPAAMSLQAAPTAVPAVSQEQIEAGIEKVVREMLGEKIDNILTEVIQQAVDREISRLRTLLMNDTAKPD